MYIKYTYEDHISELSSFEKIKIQVLRFPLSSLGTILFIVYFRLDDMDFDLNGNQSLRVPYLRICR